ncbi:hypothetical protein LR48_Vigan06g060100 [Vigna angularis]|uniref:Uncharacterized protein n=1 Tax=Phaseolus angularis TaxID=3914 RepID=A0A0L9UQX4_PHAAN|nr:hypothetical protein LR48_Vigan06g060100 [Vigna angularis]
MHARHVSREKLPKQDLHRRNVRCTESYPLDRTASRTETDGGASPEQMLEEENLEETNLVEVEVKAEP